jgi:glycosyltransferase involved in cell wall biosynthesis
VALVHDWLTGMRGGEKVLESLASLFPGAPLFTLFHFPGRVSEALESHPIHTSFLQGAPGVERHYRRYLPLFPAAIEEFDLTGYRLIVSSSHCVAKGVIPPPDAFHLCYCHTPMRYAWDQEHVYFPKRNGLGARLRSLALSGLRAWDAASAARVHLYVANSRFVAQRIRTYYGRDAEVVPPPVDTDFFTPVPENGRGEGYCLMVTALAPYKRVELAIAACDRVGIELRIVGEGPEQERLQALAGPRTRFLGRVDDERLRDLYRGARLFLQPGVEDFGIASVEALACGTPVVAVDRGGIVDIVEDGRHGLLYPDWGGPADLAAMIDKALQIGFNRLDLRGRAESFSRDCFISRIGALLPSF